MDFINHRENNVKNVSFLYESVIQKKIAPPPPQNLSYGLDNMQGKTI